MNNKLDIEKKRWAELAGINLNESERNKKETAHLVEYIRANDGTALGIVKENQKFYIKKTSKKGDLVVEDFDYLKGHMYRSEASFNSINRAQKELKNYINEINESTSNIDDNFDIVQFRKKYFKENEEKEMGGEPERKEKPSPAQEVDTTDIEDEVQVDASEIEPAPAGDMGGEQEDEGLDSVASIVGRFSQELGERELTPEEGKSILNTAITITAKVMPEFEDVDKEGFIKRIENNGQKLDEKYLKEDDDDMEDVVGDIHASLSMPDMKQDFELQEEDDDDDMLEIDLESKKIKIPLGEAKSEIRKLVKEEKAKVKVKKLVEYITEAILEGKNIEPKSKLNKEIYKTVVEEMSSLSRKMLREFIDGKKIEPKTKAEKVIYKHILEESKSNKKLIESVKKGKLKLIKEAIKRKSNL